MSHAIPFDTLAFVKELEVAGVPSAQAEAQANALSRVIQKVEATLQEGVATRRDVDEVRLEVEKVRKEISDSKAETIKWMVGMFAAQTMLIIGTMFAMMKMNQHAPPAYAPPHTSQEMRLPYHAPQLPSGTPPTR
ncbi:MAG: DUF1640 domain-containing protein [Magnetococcales bacterium]|nr:DUF1640 domain-containing protein [Magnetococcales bacterium]MBF0321989.1 DUF1640 domain-containing protein [Magnetococcales bacterium]